MLFAYELYLKFKKKSKLDELIGFFSFGAVATKPRDVFMLGKISLPLNCIPP